MDTKNINEIFTKYKSQWIALDNDNHVIVSAKTLEDLVNKAREICHNDDFITFLVPNLKNEFVL